MIEWLLGGGLVASSGAFIALAFLNRKDNRELVMAQKTISDTQSLANEYKAQRDQKAAALDVTSAELAETKERLASAESQRDDAWRLAREEIAKHIMDSDLAGAVDIGNHILSAPLPGTRLSDTADGALEKP